MPTRNSTSEIATGSQTTKKSRPVAKCPKQRWQRRLLLEQLEGRRVLAFSLPGLGEFPSDASEMVASLVDRAEGGERLRVIVEIQQSALDKVSAQVSEQGATLVHRYDLFPLAVMEVNAGSLHALLHSPSVVSLMEDAYEFPALNGSLPAINAPQVHALGLDGDGVTVAILDTGIDRNHPFFAGRVVEEACYSNGGGSAGGVSLCPNGSASQTGVGAANSSTAACVNGSTNLCTHGPHVAGIAAGDGTGVSGAPTAGVAPGADIIAIQVFTRSDSETTCGTGKAPCVISYASDQIAGLERVLALSSSYTIAAANMSLGGSATYSTHCDSSQGSRKTAIDNLRAANIATVIASGNSSDANGISVPACISTAVAVGRTTNSDGISSSGNRGPLLDLFAPGDYVRSAVANNDYGYKSGTSMAAPHVAGAWAVLRQADPSLSVTEILDLLRDTGQPITYPSGGTDVTTPRINLLAAVQETQRVVDNFHWANIPDQTVGTSFPVTITAKNSSGETVTDFNGTADLGGYVGSAGSEVTIGQGTSTWTFPFHTFYHDSRTQVIYLQSEIGSAGTIGGLALDVATVPGQELNNWTIRMKHTSLTSYATASLDATGWTTVYQANEPQGVAGWRDFVFSAPFEYNGTDNLMIDLSHNNSSYTSDGGVRATDTRANRTATARSDSGFGDPLTWSGTSSPTVTGSVNIPNVRLTMDSTLVPVSISPAVTGSFVAGVWTGHVTVDESAAQMYLRADAGADRVGDSNAFNVVPLATTTVVASSLNPSTYGDAVYFTATVSASSGTPTGTVQFLANGTNFGAPVALASGQAQSASIAAWNAATYIVTAQYLPADPSGFAPSSGALSGDQVIDQRPITVTAVVDTKVYDGTTASAGAPTITTGSLAVGDTAVWTQTFDTKLVGTNKTLTPEGTVNDGHGGDNYDVTFAPNYEGVILESPTMINVQLVALVAPSGGDEVQTLPESIAEIVAGETFYLEVWVQDIGRDAGVAGGYVTLTDTMQATVPIALHHSELYSSLGTDGEIIKENGQWRVESFGGGTMGEEQPDGTYLGVGKAPDWVRMGYVEYLATGSGTLEIEASPGSLEFALFAVENIPWQDVGLGSVSVLFDPVPQLTSEFEAGTLTISDVNAEGRRRPNELSVRVEDGFLLISDANEQFVSAPAGGELSPDGRTLQIPLNSVTGPVVINMGNGDDVLTLDFSGGNPIPDSGLHFDGDDGEDNLIVKANGGDIGFTLNNTMAKTGTITVGGSTITYENVEPDTVTLQDGATVTLTLTDGDTVGFSSVSPTRSRAAGESNAVEFDNPSTKLIVNSGDSNNYTLSFNSLAADFNASDGIEINGASGAETVTIGNLGDSFDKALVIDLGDGTDSITFDGTGANGRTYSALTLRAETIQQTNDATLTVSGTTILDNQGSANALTLTNAGNDFASIHVTAADAEVNDSAGGLVLAGGNVSGTLSLTTVGGLSQTGAINAGSLSASNSGSGDINLGMSANAIGVFAANNNATGGTVNVQFTGTGRSIGTVGTVSGITTSNGSVAVSHATNNTLTLAANISTSGGSVSFASNTTSLDLGGNPNIATGGGSLTVSRPINADSAASNRTLTVNTGTGSASFGNIGSTRNVQSFALTSGADSSVGTIRTRSGGVNITASGITLNGEIRTNTLATAGQILISGAVTLGAEVLFNSDATTTDGTITLATDSSVTGAQGLTLNAGTANVVLNNTTFGTTMNLTTLSITGAAITGSGSLATTGGVTIVNSVAGTLSGEIGGNGSLTKAGDGTLTLSGVNTYTGATTVSGGTLLVNGSTAAGSTVTVADGATLGGTGTVGGTVNVADGGTVAPGTSPGILETGSVTFVSGASLNVEINGTTLGAQYDQLDVTGAVVLGGATLDVTLGTTPAAGHTFTIINNDGGDAVEGQFHELPEGGVFQVTTDEYTATFRITYVGGDGNDVVLTVAAPPRVTGAYVRGAGWNQGYLDMLASAGLGSAIGGFELIDGVNQLAVSSWVTWETINQVAIRFDREVTVEADALRVFGSGDIEYPLASGGFSYDAEQRLAQWTLVSPLPHRKFLLALDASKVTSDGVELDGEWITSETVYPSGDGQPSGDFNFRFNYLTGDVNHSGQTDVVDWRTVRTFGLNSPDASSFRYDFDASNQIDVVDWRKIRNTGLLSLDEFGEPSIPPPLSAGGEEPLFMSGSPVPAAETMNPVPDGRSDGIGEPSEALAGSSQPMLVIGAPVLSRDALVADTSHFMSVDQVPVDARIDLVGATMDVAFSEDNWRVPSVAAEREDHQARARIFSELGRENEEESAPDRRLDAAVSLLSGSWYR